MSFVLGAIGLILKIIGILFLIVLGLVLALLCIVLFVPVCYELAGGRAEALAFDGSVRWLHFFGISFHFDDTDSSLDVILPKPLKKLLDSNNDEGCSNESFDEEFVDYGDFASDKSKDKDRLDDNFVDYDDSVSAGAQGEASEDIGQPQEEKSAEIKNEAVNTPPPKEYKLAAHREDSKRQYYENRLVRWLKARLAGIKSFAVGIKDNADRVKQLNRHFDIKLLIKRSLWLLKKLFSSLGLQLFEFCGIIGFEDPELTGLCMAAFSALKPYIPGKAQLSGNFEQKQMSFDVRLCGRVFPFKIIIPVVVYIFTKPVWPVVKFYMRGEDGE